MVSINSERENHFVWRLCGTGTDNPILHPLMVKRDHCWLGLTEIYGNQDTSQAQQKWAWADGSAPSKYTNWRIYFSHGSEYDEPNNGREGPDSPPKRTDERYAIMNDKAGGFSGKWYDRSPSFQALPACEMAGKTAGSTVNHNAHAHTVEAFPSTEVVAGKRASLRGRREQGTMI